MPLVQHSVRLPNAVTLRYVEQGPKDGLPIILLHGYPDSWRSYESVMAHLPIDFRVIAPSLRGYGDSDAPLGTYHPRDLAADVAELMAALGMRSAYVVGHSMGTYVAECLALDHPERVLGLVLISTLRNLAARSDMKEVATALEAMQGEVDPAFVCEFQQSTLANPIPAAVFETLIAESRKVPMHVYRGAFKALMEFDPFDQLGRIDVPALLLWGDQDGMSTLQDQQSVARAMPRSTLRIWGAAGHSLKWEDPARFAAELAQFVTDCSRRGLAWMRPASQHRR